MASLGKPAFSTFEDDPHALQSWLGTFSGVEPEVLGV